MSASHSQSASPEAQAAATRLVSLDAYRGMVMLLMASNGLQIAKVAPHFPDSPAWQFLALETDHVRWQGCHLWDLIMPAFIFMVGMSIPYSIASRRRRGETTGRIIAHALARSLVLVLFGVMLHVHGDPGGAGNVNFINVLAQIGLGYWAAFLIAQRPVREQVLAFVLILVGYWYLFYAYPVPGPSYDYASVGVPKEWHHLEGAAAHWDLNTNPGTVFDQWLLNLFPREKPFVFRRGGGSTINFIPAIATMLLGVMAAQWLRWKPSPSVREGQARKVGGLLAAGLLLMAAGIALDPAILPNVESTRWSICPIIKCLWTPSFVIYTGGWVLLGLAFLYWVIDVLDLKPGAFPFVVVGMNSLVMYLMAWFIAGPVRHTLYALFSKATFETTYGPIAEQLAVLTVMWLICLWLYRQKVFVRI